MSCHINAMCDLYDLVQSLTQKLYKKHKNLDHLKLVQCLEDALGDEGQIRFDRWHEDLQHGGLMYTTFTRKVLPLPEKVVSGSGVEELLDKNHFMIQIFRIPVNEVPTLANLLKIAVYTGILLQILRVNDFPEGIVKAYKDLKMHNMINYISRDGYTALMEKMPDDMVSRVTEGMILGSMDS